MVVRYAVRDRSDDARRRVRTWVLMGTALTVGVHATAMAQCWGQALLGSRDIHVTHTYNRADSLATHDAHAMAHGSDTGLAGSLTTMKSTKRTPRACIRCAVRFVMSASGTRTNSDWLLQSPRVPLVGGELHRNIGTRCSHASMHTLNQIMCNSPPKATCGSSSGCLSGMQHFGYCVPNGQQSR